MTGRTRWKDTLPDIGTPPTLYPPSISAMDALTSALIYHRTDRTQRMLHAAGVAAAWVRAWRKSLGVESDRLERILAHDEHCNGSDHVPPREGP